MAPYSRLKVRCEARSIDQEARQERSAGPEQAVVRGARLDRGKGRKGPEGRDCRRCSEALLGRAFRSPRAGHRVLHQHQLSARGTFEPIFVFSVIFACQSVFGASSRCRGVEVSCCKRRKRIFGCKCTYAYERKLAQKFAGDLPGFVQRRPGEGIPKPDPLLQSTHPDKRVGFHMSNLLLGRLRSCRTGRTKDFSPCFVLRLCLCSVGCYFGRANHISDTWLTFSALG